MCGGFFFPLRNDLEEVIHPKAGLTLSFLWTALLVTRSKTAFDGCPFVQTGLQWSRTFLTRRMKDESSTRSFFVFVFLLCYTFTFSWTDVCTQLL